MLHTVLPSTVDIMSVFELFSVVLLLLGNVVLKQNIEHKPITKLQTHNLFVHVFITTVWPLLYSSVNVCSVSSLSTIYWCHMLVCHCSCLCL